MDELVSIIDQRNQIISILDQDMQRYTAKKKTIHGAYACVNMCVCLFFLYLIREREEDKILKVVMKSKGDFILFFKKKSPFLEQPSAVLKHILSIKHLALTYGKLLFYCT